MNFDDVMLYGLDWELFVWDVIIFQLWQMVIADYGDSVAIACFLTFMCDKVLMVGRTIAGEKNLSKKSIIDNKFFI